MYDKRGNIYKIIYKYRDKKLIITHFFRKNSFVKDSVTKLDKTK